MSNYATIIFCFVLIVHVAVHVIDSSVVDRVAAFRMQTHDDDDNNNNSNNQERGHQSTPNQSNPASTGHRTWRNIGLVELTPSLEEQLNQARHLNSGDPGSMIELTPLANEAYRYEIDEGNSQQIPRTGNRPESGAAQSRLGRQVISNSHLFNGAHWPSDKTSDSHGEKRPIGGFNNGIEFRQFRFSRASPMASFGRSATAAAVSSRLAGEQDGDYYNAILDGGTGSSSTVSSVLLAPAGNQEDASRKSLWTSELLRDLLIAQEARNRARLIEKLTRSHEHDRGANQNSIDSQDSSERIHLNVERFYCKRSPTRWFL